jgi:hypothetical protein
MIEPMRSYQLCAGLLAVGMVLTEGSATISAQESLGAQSEVTTLQLHAVRASNLKGVADLINSIVPAERVVVVTGNRQLAVFAVPSVQDAVAKRIADHEKSATLTEAIDFFPCHPHMVWNGVEQSRRMQFMDDDNGLSERLDYEFDASKRKLLVWGSESDISFVQIRACRFHAAQ